MNTTPLVSKRRKFCCCFTASDSEEEERSIHLQRVESDTSPSVLEPDIYTIRNFTADKIHYLHIHNNTVLTTFRHRNIETDLELYTQSDKPTSIPDDFWKDRFKYFSKFDQGIELLPTSFTCEVQEKLAKDLVKFLMGRTEYSCCLIFPCGVGSVPIQFAKNMKVFVIEESQQMRMCLEKNAEVYEVGLNRIEFREESFLQDVEGIDLVIVWPQIDRKAQLRAGMLMGELEGMVRKALGITQNVVVLLPPTVDPYEFAEIVLKLEVAPCVEFVLLFDNRHLKEVACFVGNTAKFSMQDIVDSILSRLVMGKRQKEFMSDVIKKISLKKVLQILDRAENESNKGSIIQNLKSKSRKFIEHLKEEEDVSMDLVIVLYKGSDGDEVARLLEQASLFFVEVENSGDSFIEYNRSKIEGFETIAQFIQDLQIKETPNKNSLFQLIG